MLKKLSLRDRFVSLDATRGFAILWIVSFYILQELQVQYSSFWDFLNFIFNQGHLGAQMYFVVTGYTLSHAVFKAMNDKMSPMLFLKKTLFMVYVPYLAYVVTVFGLKPFVLFAYSVWFDTHYTFASPGFSLWEWFQILTLFKIFTVGDSVTQTCQFLGPHIWLIAVIAHVHIVICVAAFWPKHFQRILFGIYVFSLLLNLPFIKSAFPDGLFLLYWPDFYLGLMLFHVLRKGWFFTIKTREDGWQFRAWFLGWLLLTMFIFTFMFTPFIFSVSVAILLWFFYALDVWLRRVIVTHFFEFIALFSYSLYLMQLELAKVVAAVSTGNPNPPYEVNHFGLVMITAVLAGLWYWVFERKPLQWSDKYLKK